MQKNVIWCIADVFYDDDESWKKLKAFFCSSVCIQEYIENKYLLSFIIINKHFGLYLNFKKINFSYFYNVSRLFTIHRKTYNIYSSLVKI